MSTSGAESAYDESRIHFIDIGVNLTDPVFRGIYHGKRKHEDDLDMMIERSSLAGVKSMIITGGSLHESELALSLAHQKGLYVTVGCHPTRSREFDQHPGGPDAYLLALDKLIGDNLRPTGRVVAIGECGLDYDRTHFASKEEQRRHFRSQLVLAKKYHLPLFLHSRAAHVDLVRILKEEGLGENGGRGVGAKGGVVHSFTGSSEEAAELIEMGFYIGVNGCSMKTEQNLQTVKTIPLGKLLLETDAPWCCMTSTHASKKYLDTLPASLRSRYLPAAVRPESFISGKAVKGRNEPSLIGGVAWVVCSLSDGIPFEKVAEIVYKNTVQLFELDLNEWAMSNPTLSSSTVYSVLSAIGLGWYVVLWSIGLVGCWTGRKRYRLRPRSPLATSPDAPGVSILRPLKGLDTNLYENLESTFVQEYPNFEILFSVADEGDQALTVVRELMSQYPQVNAEIIIGEEIVGVNPKVNNLMKSYRQAAHDILWVIDSNVSVARGTLARSVDVLTQSSTSQNSSKKRIALIHHVPFATEHEGYFGAQVEAAFLNTNHAKMYLAINTVAIESCVVGKSNLYRRSDLERVNGSLKPGKETGQKEGEYGLAAFGSFLAEDNMIGSALWHALDLRHDLSCDVAHNAMGRMTLSDYVWRRVRWIRVRKHMVIAATILEPFTENLVASSIAAASAKYLFGVSAWIFLPIHHTLWLWVDLDVYESLAGYSLPAQERWKFLAAWCIREVLTLPIWFLAICGNEVTWRGKRYQVLRAGQARRTGNGSTSSWSFWRRWWWHREGESLSQYEVLAVDLM